MHLRKNDRADNGLIYHAVIFAAAFIILACQFVYPGYYHKFVEDTIYTPCYIAQFTESYRQGIFYPRWMPLCFEGYGSPVFVFYSPLFYMITGLMHLGGLEIPTAVNLVKLLAVYAGGVSVFYLVREDHADRAALLAGLCYVMLPSSILENYLINTPAGRLSSVWLPLTLLAARRLVRGPASFGNTALMGLTYGGLVLTHIATAFIFSPFIALFGLWGINKATIRAGVLRLALGVGLGLCLSAALMLPVLTERSLTQIDLLGTLKYMSDWRKPLLLVMNAPENYYVRHLWNVVRYCIVMEAALGVLLLYILKRFTSFRFGDNERVYYWLLFVALFMMSSLSAPLWKYLPGMSAVNFPSRFVSIGMVFSSILIGLMLDSFVSWDKRPRVITVGVAALLVSIIVSDGLLVYRSFPPVSGEMAEKYYGKVDMVEYLPTATDIKTLYGLGGKDPLLSNTDPFFWRNPSSLLLKSDDDLSYTISRWGYVDRAINIAAPNGALVRVKTFYFPGWHAWVDGKEIPIGVEDKTGAMLIDVPAGEHSVKLKFTDTWPRKAGWIISLITLAGMVLILPYKRIKRLVANRRHRK